MGARRNTRRWFAALLVALFVVAVGCTADNQQAGSVVDDTGGELDPDIDSDGDGFTNGDELDAGSDPDDKDSTPDTVDSDGDGFSDKDEIAAGSDPDDEDSTPESGDGGSASGPQGLCQGVTDPCVEVDESQTCHNITPPDYVGGFSTEVVSASLFNAPAGSEVTLFSLVVSGQAPGSPGNVRGFDTVGADGTVTVDIGLYAPNETLEIVEILVDQEAVPAATLGDFSFTVLPLDDPSTECDER